MQQQQQQRFLQPTRKFLIACYTPTNSCASAKLSPMSISKIIGVFTSGDNVATCTSVNIYVCARKCQAIDLVALLLLVAAMAATVIAIMRLLTRSKAVDAFHAIIGGRHSISAKCGICGLSVCVFVSAQKQIANARKMQIIAYKKYSNHKYNENVNSHSGAHMLQASCCNTHLWQLCCFHAVRSVNRSFGRSNWRAARTAKGVCAAG